LSDRPAAPVDRRGIFVSNPVNSTDRIFLKHFAMLIGFLIVLALVLMALGAHIYASHPPETNPKAAEATDDRIAPVGAVYAGDTGRAAMAAAQEAAKAAAASQVAYGGTTDGKTIFGSLCHSCHETGAGGAPRITDKGAWAPRVSGGIETLVKHAIEGYTGKSGVMPPKGGNPALTDEQIKATVTWMIDQVK
jgi:cytochrome c5